MPRKSIVAILLAAPVALAGCAQSVRRVPIPPASDQAAYQPVPYDKPLPPDAYGGQAPSLTARTTLPGERRFIRAYRQARDPRLMVLVHRDVRHGYDRVGASSSDYQAIAISLIDYLNSNGQVDIRDARTLKAKLSRERFIAVENRDSGALKLLKHELQTDVLIDVSATPTSQASTGSAVRLLAQALSTTDGRVLGAEYVDMPLPMTRTNINMYTRFLAIKLMGKMADVWRNGGHAYHPLEVRVYKARNVDAILRIRRLIQRVSGVRGVIDRGITGGNHTSYGVMDVRYDGSPTAFYRDLKRRLDHAKGLKAVDIQNNTIDLQVTGRMDLRAAMTTTRTPLGATRASSTTVVDQPIEPATR